MDTRTPEALKTPETHARPEWIDRLARPRLIALGAGLLIVAVLMTGWILDRAAHVSTSDARIAADMVAVSTDVSGRVTELHVSVGDRVRAGDLLYAIDAREALYQLSEYEAEAARLDAEIAREAARIGLSASKASSEIDASRAGSRSADASVEAARSDLSTTERDFARAKDLFDRGLTTQSALDQVRNRLESARQTLAMAEARRASASAVERRACVSSDEVELIERNLDVLRADRERVAARIARQQVAVDQHEIRSPIDGVVDELFYDVGEHTLLGFRVALLHNPDTVWVNANIKETEVRHVHPGARVDIRVDSAPDAEVTGRVALVRDLTVAEAAMMPNPNATGVFTKITQRIPIRIEIDSTDIRLRPGTMVTVKIDKSDGEDAQGAGR